MAGLVENMGIVSDGSVDFEATRALISEIDKKADALRKKITESKSKYSTKGRIYYVSTSGDDRNDGLSPKSAWKTPSRVSDAPELQPGDSVLFERGKMFRGNTILCKDGVTYSAYGEGAKPIINASPENGAGASNWKRLSGTKNIWVYRRKMIDVGMLIFDDGANHGYKQVPDFIGGKYYVRDTEGREEFDVRKHLTSNFQFFSDCYNKGNRNVPQTYNDDCTGTLYLYCDMGNPGAVFSSIEFAVRRHCILVGKHRNVTIDNLCIKYAGAHGVGAGDCHGLTVRNCVICWIGGTVQYYRNGRSAVRYGNGIEIYGGCTKYTVESNYVYECYDAAATHQYSRHDDGDVLMQDVVYRNNLFEKNVYSVEYFLGDIPAEGSNISRIMRNILVKDNIMRYAGYGFGAQRCDVRNEAFIKTWSAYNRSDNFVIENNIFDRSRETMISTSAIDASWLPKFRNNIYIQYLGSTGSLGRYGTTPPNPAPEFPWTADAKAFMKEKGIDEDAIVFFAEPDELSKTPAI